MTRHRYGTWLAARLRSTCKSSSHNAKIALFAAFAVIGLRTATTALAQLGPNALETGSEFVLAAYPELRGSKARLSVVTDEVPLDYPWVQPARFYFRITKEEIGKSANHVLELQSKQLIAVDILLNAESRIVRFSAQGEFVSTDRVRLVADEVDGHPKWTDKEVLRILKTKGARATPDQIESADDWFQQKAKQVEGMLGVIDVRSVEFVIRDENQRSAGLPAAELLWTVTVETTPWDVKPSVYMLTYEPFEGRLTHIQGHTL